MTGKIALVLSTWFGVGLLPAMPGTFGTLAAVPIVFACVHFGLDISIICLATLIVFSIWSAQKSVRMLGQNDPPQVVIDEVAGFLLTMFLIPLTWWTLLSGFILFRAFDIFKPPPIRQVERLGMGFGIVMDDLLAGVFAHIGLRCLVFFVE